jgi:hypothetical protein
MMSKFPPPSFTPASQAGLKTAPEEKPDEAKIQQEALTVVEKAALVKITDQASYNFATDLLTKEIKPMRKQWEAYWHGSDAVPGPIKLAYRSYKSLLDKFNDADKKLEKAESQVKAEILRFDNEQARILAEAQRKAQEEAEALEREKREQEAAEMEAQGVSEEEVEEFIAAPVVAIAAPVAPTYEKASGVSRRENWGAVVTDLKALAKAVGAGKVPVDYILPNQSALNARAKADKSTMNVPGVVAKDSPIIAGRGR